MTRPPEWLQPGDPPEFARYASREEALARQEHFALHPGAVKVIGHVSRAEAVRLGWLCSWDSGCPRCWDRSA
jgi:hypothetical protein